MKENSDIYYNSNIAKREAEDLVIALSNPEFFENPEERTQLADYIAESIYPDFDYRKSVLNTAEEIFYLQRILLCNEDPRELCREFSLKTIPKGNIKPDISPEAAALLERINRVLNIDKDTEV
jgi:hypothetical protein